MNKEDLIIKLKELFILNPNECNKILETASNGYEKNALASKNFHQTIKQSPLYWEAKIEWYNSQTIAPLQLWGFEYVENESNLIALADNYLTGPPDMYTMYIQDVPMSVLIAAIHKIENNSNNINMSQKHHYTGLTDKEVLESRRKMA